MRANGKITAADLRLATAVRHLAPPGGTALVTDVAARMGRPVVDVLRAADASPLAHRYAYQGRVYVGLSEQGWEIRRD